jgi:hypothetical protein
MSITVKCPGCSGVIPLGDELAGKRVRCQKCQTVFDVPAIPPPAAVQPAEPAPPPEPAPATAAAEPPVLEAVAAGPPKEAPAKPPPLRPGRPRTEEGDRPQRRRDQKAAAGSIAGLVVGLVALLLLGSCCVAVPVLGWLFFRARPADPPPMVAQAVPPPVANPPGFPPDVNPPIMPPGNFPPPNPGVPPGGFPPGGLPPGGLPPGGLPPGGLPPGMNPPGFPPINNDLGKPPPPPANPDPPVAVKFDGKGVFETKIALDPNDADPLNPANRVCRRFEFTAKADKAYVVDMPGENSFSVRVEPPGGAPPIEPRGNNPFGGPAPGNQVAFLADKAGRYVVFVTGFKHETNRAFPLRIREWDETEPLPEHLKFPTPPGAVPRVEVAQNVKDKLFMGGAFSPDNKFFWTSNHEMTLTLWEHPVIEKKGEYKLPKKRLYALAVDGKGRLYAQPGPASNDTRWGQRVVADIEVYENLHPKGDADQMPPPTRVIQVRGIIDRMISSRDGRWVYFLDKHNRKLCRIDTETGAVDKTVENISTSTVSFCLTPNGKKIYCCSTTNRIDVIDAEKFQHERAVPLTKGQPHDIAATDKGLVFLAGANVGAFPLGGNLMLVDLGGKVPDKATPMPIKGGGGRRFLQLASDQTAVFASGDRNISVVTVPARPALFDMAAQNYHTRDFYGNDWFLLSPDGRTILYENGTILSVSR